MKSRLILAALSLALCGSAALAGGKYWNDAVKTVDGKRVVELPPTNPNKNAILRAAPKSWTPPTPLTTYVMEGPEGLVECVAPYFVGGGRCHAYRPGMYGGKRQRVWVVKREDKWWNCSLPTSDATCKGSWQACMSNTPMQNRCIPQYKPTSGGIGEWIPPFAVQP